MATAIRDQAASNRSDLRKAGTPVPPARPQLAPEVSDRRVMRTPTRVGLAAATVPLAMGTLASRAALSPLRARVLRPREIMIHCGPMTARIASWAGRPSVGWRRRSRRASIPVPAPWVSPGRLAVRVATQSRPDLLPAPQAAAAPEAGPDASRPGRLQPGLTCAGKDPVSFAPRSLLPGGHGHQRQAASRGPGLPHPVPDPKG